MENFYFPSSQSSASSQAALGQAHLSSRDPIPDPISHPEPKKRRQAITNVQRKDIRIHKQALIQETGKWSISQIVEFYHKKYHRILSQSTISGSLSDKFKHLDEEDQPLHPDSKVQRKGYWPDLDAAVFDWQQRMLKKNVTVTNASLKSIAKKLFFQLPQYRDVEPPQFSTGWLLGYKGRYNDAKTHSQYDESGTVDLAVAETQLERLRESLKFIKREDIYIMDETALFWKKSPDGALASQSEASGKLDKARITVNLACNITGTRKLPPWFIGKAQTPRCFDNSGIYVENFPMVWRYNGMAWMTGVMFEEYLRWFDRQMAGRHVCLVIDELSAHHAGLGFLHSNTPEGLRNTRIFFLPTIITSIGPPLDQGIFQSWKAHYRRRWLTYMCDEYDEGRDPMKSVNVLQAIRWGIAAWEDDVSPTIIQHCWMNSRVMGPNYGIQREGWKKEVEEDAKIFSKTMTQMEQQVGSLKQQQCIQSAMKISLFVHPLDEVVIDEISNEDLVASLVEIYSTGGVERDRETDEEDVSADLIYDEEAVELVSRLRLYEEQQADGDPAVISSLNKYENEVRARTME